MNQKEKTAERSRLCNKLAFECRTILVPKLDEIIEQLENRMEISHFLSCLNNRLAIELGLLFGVKGEKDGSG